MQLRRLILDLFSVLGNVKDSQFKQNVSCNVENLYLNLSLHIDNKMLLFSLVSRVPFSTKLEAGICLGTQQLMKNIGYLLFNT